jgi:hypothetical protein
LGARLGMAEKGKDIFDKETLFNCYWDYYLEEGKRPASVYKFCKHLSIEEVEFYQHFSSFDVVESFFWEKSVTETLEALASDEEYRNFSTRQKVLAYCYTFFTISLSHRSKFLLAFPRFPKNELSHLFRYPKSLKKFSNVFTNWVEERIREGIQNEEIVDRMGIHKFYPNLLCLVHWYLIDYNLNDSSSKFEDTDTLIEKVVNTFFDTVQSQVFESVFDLFRFLIKSRT